LILDDDAGTTIAFKIGIENAQNSTSKRIAMHAYNDPTVALSEFQPNFYDLLLTDSNMPGMN